MRTLFRPAPCAASQPKPQTASEAVIDDGLPRIRPINPKHSIDPARVTYSAGGLITVNRCDFLNDRRFRSAYATGMQATGRSPRSNNFAWRVHTICWAAQHALKLPGDFVECGVWQGMFSRTAIEYTGFAEMPDRKFYLFDTFEGLAIDLLSAEERRREEKQKRNERLYGGFYEAAQSTFAEIPNAVLVRGRVPDTLATQPIDRVAYLSIDMNCAFPEIEAVRYFWPKLSQGAPVILDDYGFDGHDEQRIGMDRLGEELGFEVLCLPTGQGLIIRS
jgi:O-methyltransferase